MKLYGTAHRARTKLNMEGKRHIANLKAPGVTVEKCVHHWRINEHNVGVCIKCGEEKDFGVLLDRGARVAAIAINTGRHGSRRRDGRGKSLSNEIP